jgi:zinc/manganese transport system substrate-binding protein
MKRLVIALILALLAGPVHAAEPLQVVASFSILGDLVRQIGGDAVAVKTLVGPDSDAHHFEPTPADAKAITTADLIFVNGLGLEGWLDRMAVSSGAKAKVVVASEGVQPRQMEEEGEGKVTDPHAWQNLSNGRIYVKNISEALIHALPKEAAAINARAAKYDARLTALDKDIKDQFAGLPQGKRKIITSHDAFGYFGAAYGVEFLAPEGVSTEAEPSAEAVAKLITQMKKEGVKVVFFENMENTRLIQQIARETGASIGGTLYSDALSEPTGPAPTYLDMFKNNVPKLIKAIKENK